MGLYDDLTTDITEAFDTDLADAVKSITIVSFGVPVYDPVAGTNTPVETSVTTRGVVTKLMESDVIDDSGVKNDVSILILDSEKKVSEFETGMKISIDTDPQTYKLSDFKTDPAKVTHTLYCSRWG